MNEADYAPSASARVRDQVALYEATGGVEGGTLEGRPVVILTMIGASSGTIRKTAVMRIESDGTYLAVASAGGATKDPAWYRNLVAHPDVRLQDGTAIHTMRAREVSGEEKARAWELAELRWPHFPEYRALSGRDIPILKLEPVTITEETPVDARMKTPGPDHPITIEPNSHRVVVRIGQTVIADTTAALTLREAAYPPVQYVPLADINADLLTSSDTHTYCPYKGEADYHGIAGDDGEVTDAAWVYRAPYPAVAAIADHLAFYPDAVQIEVVGGD